MAISSATAAANGTQATLTGRERLADNFDTFLTLLTTQLKNQDPSQPLDSNQFTAQLVQMSGVEQQLLTNDLLKAMVDNSTNGIGDAVSLIGKDVRAVGQDAALNDGKARWGFNLPSQATSVTLEIRDSAGRVVNATALSDVKAGDHDFVWDGKDQAGRQLPDGGPYRLVVTAKDAAGAALAPITYVDGRVSAVEQADGATWLTVSGARIPWDQVKKITETAPQASPVSQGA